MSALDAMVRIHRWMLDEKRRKLTDTERFADKIRRDLAALDEHLGEERAAAAASPESAPTYAAFIRAALERREKLLGSVADMEREVEKAREEVRETFQELKKFQKAEARAQSREESARKKREQLALDALGIGIYQRRAGGEG